jgi:hypothetical protein
MSKTTYTPAIGKEICKAMAQGRSFHGACRLAGIPSSTADKWLKAHVELREAAQKVQDDAEAVLIKQIQKAAKSGTKSVTVKVRDGEGGYTETTTTTTSGEKYALWMLPRLNPERWSNERQIEIAAQAKHRECLSFILKHVDDHSKRAISELMTQAWGPEFVESLADEPPPKQNP